MKDLYSILDLPTNANISEIKKSYRKLAFAYHPDKNKEEGSQKRFQDISEAYAILSHPEKKRMYDQFGYDTLSESNGDPINPIELFQSLFNVDFTREMTSNIFYFSDLTRSPFSANHKMVHEVACTLDELYQGTQKEFAIQRKERNGRISSTKYVINIKAGSQDGENIVVKDGGNYLPDLQITEDLVIQVKQLDHELYERRGDDLYREFPISLSDALTGLTLRFTHFTEELTIQIKEIVKPNSLYQVFGKGMPIKSDSPTLSDGSLPVMDKGNLFLDLKILFPEYLDDTQKDYLRQILGSEKADEPSDSLVTQAYYYKDKSEVVKELLNEAEEEESVGCLQQ